MLRKRATGVQKLAIFLAFGLLLWALREWSGNFIPGHFSRGEPEEIPKAPTSVRIVSWNLRNFGADESSPRKHRSRLQGSEDMRPRASPSERLEQHLDKLQPDLLAVQELVQADALQRLRPKWHLLTSSHGGQGEQRLGLLYNPKHLSQLNPPIELETLSFNGRLRPGLAARFQSKIDGTEFWVLVVHLKSRPSGYDQRKQQIERLKHQLRSHPRLSKSDNLILLGDFNLTGSSNFSSKTERQQINKTLAEDGFRALSPELPCSAYWDGKERDVWQEPSLLDLIWVRGLEHVLPKSTTVKTGAHCAKHHCKAFRSSSAYPELDFADLSDHCPQILDLYSSHEASSLPN